MKRFPIALATGLIPMVAATSVIVIGWSTWLASAPLSQHMAVSRALTGDVFARFGAGVGLYLRPCPSLLVATTLSAQVMLPLSIVLFTSLFGASDLKRRLQCLFVGTSSLLLVPHMMGAAALIYLVPTLATTNTVSWACSLWVRATLVALPLCALVLCVTSSQGTVWRRALVGSLAIAGLWLVRAIMFADADLLQMTRPFVMSVSARDVAIGSALSCSGAVLLVALPNLSRFVVARWVSMFSRTTVVVAVAGGVFLSSGSARAYTKEGHFELTNGAYQILRLASASPATGPESALKVPGTCATGTGLCGTAVSQAQWDEFLKDLDWTRRYLGSLPNSIPDTTATQSCATSGAAVDASDFVVTSSGRASSLNTSHRHLNANECRADKWVRLGPQKSVIGRVPADGKGQQGKVLGWHAKNRDDDLSETRIDTNPIIGLPLGTLLSVGSEAYEKLLGAVLVPFVCAFEFATGDASACMKKARRVADKTNLVEVFVALIPGFHLARSEDYIGFWHLLNVRDDGALTNAFDDHQGMYLQEAGPQMIPGAMDAALITGSQLMAIRLMPEDSAGVRRYTIHAGEDHDPPSVYRTDLEWRREPIGTTEFSPLDNLAFSGYARLFPNDPMKRLGWPLHALGDATVPMHVVATASWGHGPYEKWVELNWKDLLYTYDCKDSACESELQTQQIAQASRVLQLAFKWREYLGHGPSLSDSTGARPGVRDLITALSKDTLQRVGDNVTAWPWCDMCSVGYDGDFGSPLIETIASAFPDALVPGVGGNLKDMLDEPVGYYDAYESQIRSLAESSMAAQIAFLNWHSQYVPTKCIAENHYGCISDTECCTSGAACVENRCRLPIILL